MSGADVRNTAREVPLRVERFSLGHLWWILGAAVLLAVSASCVVGTVVTRPPPEPAPVACPTFKAEPDTAYICHTDETGCMGCYTPEEFEAFYEDDIAYPHTAENQPLHFTPKPHGGEVL